MKFKLSIIIVNYNTRKFTLGCIKSIVDSKPKVNYEIVVVDNGSEENSKIKSQNLKLQFKNQNYKLIENKSNLGFARAVNQGIKVAKGEYILLLNSDTVVKNDAIGKLCDFAVKTQDAGVVGARLSNPDGSLQASCYYFPTIIRAVNQYWLKKDKFMDKYAPKVQRPTAVEALVGACFLITPKALSKVGIFDERYFMYFEDLDYCRRIYKSGLKVYYLPSSEVIHFHGQSGKNLADSKNQWKRLIPSSKLYHGVFRHFLMSVIIWSGEKVKKLLQ
jgi:GT2 family glycosyltransferase